MLGFVVFTVVILGCSAQAEFESIGCFKDSTKNRALPELLHNFRNSINWKNEWPSFQRVIDSCASLAKDKGYLYFGLQYYGECWSGPEAHRTFYKHGASEKCFKGVGKHCANQVYMLLGPGREECSKKNYYLFNEEDRSITYKGKGDKCDNPLPHGPGWYRFIWPAGNVMAPASPGRYQCNTLDPGWMTEALPDVTSNAVEQKVCFHRTSWGNNKCKDSQMVKVKNCGHFVVYKLPVTPSCSQRYCAAVNNKTLSVKI